MASFNGFERNIAIFLRRFPRLKAYAKLVFQTLAYLKHGKRHKYRLDPEVAISTVVDSDREAFFGYFAQDVRSGEALLFHSSSVRTNCSPRTYAKRRTSIDVVCLKDGKELYRAESRAFNWQQGSKLSWVRQDCFIYNDLDENDRPIARLVDLIAGSSGLMKYPVSEVIDENSYVSLGYEALTRLNPDYGYHQIKEQTLLSYIAIVGFSGEVKLKLSIDEVNLQAGVEGDSLDHCLNHVSVSPDKSRLVLIHRSYTDGIRRDRLLIKSLEVLDSSFQVCVGSGMVSHYDWITSSSLVCYMRHKGIEGYFIIMFDGELVKLVSLDIPSLSRFGDGHPVAISPTQFVTDSYPDKARMKKLLLVDIEEKSIKVLGEFFEPIKASPEGRCDLHPRYDWSNNSIFIDSDHSGRRLMYELFLSNSTGK